MIQDGLQIGIAAWIGAQRDGDDFVVWPSVPLAIAIQGVESVATMRDVAKVAEFAYLVNFVPRKGQYAEPFQTSGVLWQIHRDLLQRMTFAVRAWTTEEDAQWRSAVAKLYEAGSDGLRMTRAYKLYEECRIGYSDLVAAAAAPAEVQRAFAEWVVNGKLEIENALSTLNRLAQQSTLPRAEEQRLLLEPVFLPSTTDGSYAPTEFAPLSAVRPDVWLSAEATFDELERSIGGSQPREKWIAWRANRAGTVRFRFVALDVRRSWFSQSIYEGDDWRITGDPVSAGDGVHGRLPAYVSSVYFAIVDEVRTAKPQNNQSPPIFVPRESLTDMRFREPIGARPVGGTGPALVSARLLTLSPEPRLGVNLRSRTELERQDLLTSPVISAHPLTATLSANLRPARFGVVNRVTPSLVAARFNLAESLVRPGANLRPPDTSTRSDASFVVGFGCTTLPASPKPNPGYQWASN